MNVCIKYDTIPNTLEKYFVEYSMKLIFENFKKFTGIKYDLSCSKSQMEIKFVPENHQYNGKDCSFDTNVLAHAFPPPIYDIHINTKYVFGPYLRIMYGDTIEFPLYNILLHEFGHSMGLSHSKERQSIMGKDALNVITLSKTDINNLQLYWNTLI